MDTVLEGKSTAKGLKMGGNPPSKARKREGAPGKMEKAFK